MKTPKNLYNMELLEVLRFEYLGDYQGDFVRVPGGWVYRYISRSIPCCCFIPYNTENQEKISTLQNKKQDIEPTEILPSCNKCKSTNIRIINKQYENMIFWNIVCLNCRTTSGFRLNKEDALAVWKTIK